MNWSKETPKVEGYYWYHCINVSNPLIAHVFQYKSGSLKWLVQFMGFPEEELRNYEGVNCEWAGPILFPQVLVNQKEKR